MRVLHISEVHWGGVVTLLRQFTEQQSLAGHDVHVLAPETMPTLPGATMHPWSVVRANPVTFMNAVRDVRDCVREVRPDVVHLHSFIAGVAGRLPSVVPSEAVTIYQPHAWAFDRFSGTRRHAVERWERVAARRTDALVTNCQDEIDAGVAKGIDLPASPIGVAVDTDVMRPPTDDERRRAKALVGFGKRRMILVLGRLAYQKGQDLMIPAWQRDPMEDTDLVFVGPGDPAPLRQLAEDQWNVSVHHRGETTDIRTWLWAADVLAIPSRYETVSLVACEAMAVGCPVVATRFSGAQETITDGSGPAGAVVDLFDMRGLLDACRERLLRPDMRVREGFNGRRRAVRDCEPGGVSARLQGAYLDALGMQPVGVTLRLPPAVVLQPAD